MARITVQKEDVNARFAGHWKDFYSRFIKGPLKKGWCPLHKGNSPSFSFVDETGIFHCHSCQEEETPSSSTAS